MSEINTKLREMFNMLQISEYYSFSQFKDAQFNALKTVPWFLTEPIDSTLKLRKGRGAVKIRKRPRVRFLGKQDVLHRQLYRYFIGEIPRGPLKALNGKNDFNPWHWQAYKVKKATPTTINNMAPKPLDEDLQELLDLVELRQKNGEDLWEGIDEIYTALEIARVKQHLHVQNET